MARSQEGGNAAERRAARRTEQPDNREERSTERQLVLVFANDTVCGALTLRAPRWYFSAFLVSSMALPT